MKRKTPVYIAALIGGICCIAASLLLRNEAAKAVSGLLIGVGAGLVGMSVAQIYMNRFESKHPEYAERTEIELKDERNTLIRYRAKAKAGDITHWLIMGIAYLTIIISAPLWVTLVVVAVFLTYTAIGLYYMNKYQKEM
ncbi:hypothetical protein [Paenibacillus sp. J22TS3]|uniref:hypothetical protein n=1 Tax=Paenibacillus sp. J22TS3 TaxID=2807192 RepID=UPI001B25E0FA|nr:hypothetical protein [Paenibacillus sp. J22TS3]GIP22278.1 hypothetical protein J22TS3_25530 [Paenibacillus sp. J22TS3]